MCSVKARRTRQGKIEEPEDYDARAEIVWAGTLAHNGLLNTGRVQDWASHRIALEMSGKYDIAHIRKKISKNIDSRTNICYS